MNVDYEKDGAAIYRASFATIRAEADLKATSPALERVLVRIIHACGMTDVPQDIQTSPNAAEAGAAALAAGAPILCDSAMVAAGITRSRLPKANDVLCTLHDEAVPELAARLGTTRSAAAVARWGANIQGAVIAIGNAPTALFFLLEWLAQIDLRPALILGFPVGFIGARESKIALAENTLGLAFLTLHGRRGGSAMASAAVNALASSQE